MSSTQRFRISLRGLAAIRLWGFCTKSFIISSIIKRCRKDRGMREVLQCFCQTFLKPRKTFLISATAAFKKKEEEDCNYESCEKNITDEELEILVSDLDRVEALFKQTLYCKRCGKRLVIEKKVPSIDYCSCQEPTLPPDHLEDGWEPYMEAEDVVIWRKQHKCGQGYAYKVYGRYKEVNARDFAAVQIDIDYRRVWDEAVASLTVVEANANGLKEQALLHWEVIWPRLFTNRDYVYLRRHKEFDVQSDSASISLIKSLPSTQNRSKIIKDDGMRENVHSRARRRILEEEGWSREEVRDKKENQIFVIVSKSCESPKVPESKNAVRVTDYWSHMIIRTLDGGDEKGMEYVLTYYEEPSKGGLPSGVANWATGRAAPIYLSKMRNAANKYHMFEIKEEKKKDDLDKKSMEVIVLTAGPCFTNTLPISKENELISSDISKTDETDKQESNKISNNEESSKQSELDSLKKGPPDVSGDSKKDDGDSTVAGDSTIAGDSKINDGASTVTGDSKNDRNQVELISNQIDDNLNKNEINVNVIESKLRDTQDSVKSESDSSVKSDIVNSEPNLDSENANEQTHEEQPDQEANNTNIEETSLHFSY